MDPILVGILGAAVLLVFIAMGIPIGIALLVAGFFGNVAILGFSPALWTTVGSCFGRITNPAFLPLPLFIFLGLLASTGGISRNVFDSLSLLIGRVRGGLGIATVLSCAAFGTVCGSSLVTASVFARVSAPEMRRHGYDKLLAYGICSSAGVIGMLIPPSVMAIVFAMVAELSVGELLVAGTGPGLLLTLIFSVGILLMGLHNPALVGGKSEVPKATWRQKIAGLKMFWPIFILTAVIFGGVFTGAFSPEEASAVAAVVMVLIILLTYGPGRWGALANVTLDTASITAMIFLILMGAAVFSDLMVTSGVARAMITFVSGYQMSPWVFLIALQVVYLIMGCFLDSTSIICITIPLVMPIARTFSFDLIWFSTICIFTIEIGLITPPVGLNVYAVKGVAESDVTLEEVFRGVLPFFFMELFALALMMLFPSTITYLVDFMRVK